MRLRLLSRGSALARLQAASVERALMAAHPGLAVQCVTRASAGDRDLASPLWQMADQGAFTADLSDALVRGEADIVVHSYKDLPIELAPGTTIAGALPRADARDLVLVRRTVLDERPATLTVLSSSPRRAWLLNQTLPGLLPWPVDTIDALPVRGNVETRLTRLIEGRAHALVVAKAALDRLLGFGAPFDEDARRVRALLDQCRWMVMPMREFPWAPAQGAIAMEIRADGEDVHALLRPVVCRRTTDAVQRERAFLAAAGGGCHQALGAAVIDKLYGRIVSLRAKGTGGHPDACRWGLEEAKHAFPRAAAGAMWPRPGEDTMVSRQPLSVVEPPATSAGLWVSRAEALPEAWTFDADRLVWAAGTRTRQRLALRGAWVHGSADGLGDEEQPDVNTLAGRAVAWVRLSHAGAAAPDVLATYIADTELPGDLPSRSHFFWTSADVFRRAIARWPSIRNGWHASGPGRTRAAVLSELGDAAQTGVWLDRESWERDICR